jgi:translation initiation factor 2B subunit (eIF-2B alpha/beta/delta family)
MNIDKLRQDNVSGATQLAGEAMAALAAVAGQYAGDGAGLAGAIAEAGDMLAGAQPLMAAIRNRARRVSAAAQRAADGGADVDGVRRAVLDEIELIGREAEHNARAVAGYGAALIPEGATVLTFSASSAVRAMLLAARSWLDRVLISESRPMDEGVELAQQLAGDGIRCELWIDAAMATLAQRAAIALVGADTVTPEYVYNKLGTQALAIVCRECGTPLYAAFTTDKMLDQELADDPQELRPPAEIIGQRLPPPGLAVMNYYFERTPQRLFSGFVTEEGIASPGK